jgi:hypothetical protein
MTLIIQKPTGAKLVLAKDFSFDPDAAAYIAAVEAADTQALETATRYAINNFVIGCKQDGIWTAIKAGCILAGARTLEGALVPLVGTAPTNFNFVAGDYNRETGLVGDGSTKYLDSNRNNNADPQNSKHLSVYSTNITDPNAIQFLMSSGTSGALAGVSLLTANGILDNIVGRANGNQNVNTAAVYGQSYLAAVNRSSDSTIELLVDGSVSTGSAASQVPNNANINIYGFGQGSSNARLAFYSIGESLDLALLDNRVTDLINAIGAAIP